MATVVPDQAAEASHDHGHVRAEDAPGHVRLVDDDQ